MRIQTGPASEVFQALSCLYPPVTFPPLPLPLALESLFQTDSHNTITFVDRKIFLLLFLTSSDLFMV